MAKNAVPSQVKLMFYLVIFTPITWKYFSIVGSDNYLWISCSLVPYPDTLVTCTESHYKQYLLPMGKQFAFVYNLTTWPPLQNECKDKQEFCGRRYHICQYHKIHVKNEKVIEWWYVLVGHGNKMIPCIMDWNARADTNVDWVTKNCIYVSINLFAEDKSISTTTSNINSIH